MVRCGGELMEEEDDEYAKLVRRMNPPRVVIDNDSCDTATVIRVDRVKKQGILLEAVQVLVDLNLIITKAYISSDGNWFMDVFNVTGQDGSKLQNREVIDHIQKCLESEDYLVPPAIGSTDGSATPEDQFTCIELTGTDRPGLLSEVCAVLAALSCNIVKAEVWTHERRAAAVIQITDEATGLAIHDAGRLSKVQELLCNVMQGDGTDEAAVRHAVRAHRPALRRVPRHGRRRGSEQGGLPRVLHPARRRAPGALRRRADPPGPVPGGRRREASMRRAGGGGEDGGQGGAAVADHARVPGEQPLHHPRGDLDQGRQGGGHVLRV